jgi:hypothetical protein
MDCEFFRDFGLKVMALFELIKNNRFKFSYIHTLKREDYKEKIKIMGQNNLKSCPHKKKQKSCSVSFTLNGKKQHSADIINSPKMTIDKMRG